MSTVSPEEFIFAIRGRNISRVVRAAIVFRDYFIKSTKGVEIRNCMLLLLCSNPFSAFINFLPFFASLSLLAFYQLNGRKSLTNI